MIFRSIGCSLDTIHISITRPRNIISFVGEETPEPTDKIFYGILELLSGKNYEVKGGSKKFVNNGSEYIESNPKEVLVQLRSFHLMKNGSSKIEEILNFLKSNEVNPKPKRDRKKDSKKSKSPTVFFQNSRSDFANDLETSFDLVKILSDGIGHRRFFSGIQKDYEYRPFHEDIRDGKGKRIHRIKELRLWNRGFELLIYNKKLEMAEKATPEKLALYPEIYRDILTDKNRFLFRVELRFFRSRSINFNHLSADELFKLPAIELQKFGKATSLFKMKNGKAIKSILFSKLFEVVSQPQDMKAS